MCDVLDRVESKGKLLRAEAKAKEAAANMYKRGMEPTVIAEILNETLDKVQQWLGIATA